MSGDQSIISEFCSRLNVQISLLFFQVALLQDMVIRQQNQNKKDQKPMVDDFCLGLAHRYSQFLR